MQVPAGALASSRPDRRAACASNEDGAQKPPLQRSTSIDSRPTAAHTSGGGLLQPQTGGLRARSSSMHHPLGLTHGLQMDLKKAVQFEKQELCKMGLLADPGAATSTTATTLAVESEDGPALSDSPPYWFYKQRYVHKAASFSSGGHPLPLPCSPPVPIPQHQRQVMRRYSAAAGLERDHAVHGVDAEQLRHVSKSQCEARLWDEFWNYKLSLEARESFEAASTTKETIPTRAGGCTGAQAPVLRYRTASSQASTADTLVEDEDYLRVDDDGMAQPEEEEVLRYGDVFEMDDL